MSEEKPFSFEGRLSRSRGRAGRDRVVSSRATADEHQELEAAAKAEGKALSEWSRDVLLREARSPRLNALFTEVVATRDALESPSEANCVRETKFTEEDFSGVLTNVRTSKRKAASDGPAAVHNPGAKGIAKRMGTASARCNAGSRLALESGRILLHRSDAAVRARAGIGPFKKRDGTLHKNRPWI